MGNLVALFHRPEKEKWFEQVLEQLAKKFNFVDLQEIVDFYHKDEKRLKNACHITFDDGEKSVYEIAYPVLKRKGIPATLFVSPLVIKNNSNYWFQDIKNIDSQVLRSKFKTIVSQSDALNSFSMNALLKSQPFEVINEIIRQSLEEKSVDIPRHNMTLDELNALSKSDVFEVGAHTINHPILQNESFEVSRNEILRSVETLSQILEKRVRAFAYPNGLPGLDFGQREVKSLEEAGVDVSFTCRYSYFKKNQGQHEIPRLEIESGSARKIGLKANYAPHLVDLYVRSRSNGAYKSRKKILEILGKDNY